MPACAFLSASPIPTVSSLPAESSAIKPLDASITASASTDFNTHLQRVSEKQQSEETAKDNTAESHPIQTDAADNNQQDKDGEKALLTPTSSASKNSAAQPGEESILYRSSQKAEKQRHRENQEERAEKSSTAKKASTQLQPEKNSLFPTTQVVEPVRSPQDQQLTPAKQDQESGEQKRNNIVENRSWQRTLLTTGLLKLSLSGNLQPTVQRKGIGGDRQKNDAIINRLQNIIDASDEMGTVSIAITKEFTTLQKTATLQEIGLSPVDTYLPVKEAALCSVTVSASSKVFSLLENTEYGKTVQQGSVVWSQTENSTIKESSSAGDNAAKSLLLQPAGSNNQDEKISMQALSMSTDKELLKNRAKTVMPEETGSRAAINSSQQKTLEFQPGSINRIFSAQSSAEGAAPVSDSGSNGTLFSHTDQPQLLQTTASPAQTITLPSGVMVRENEVVRQFIDKFQINGRNLESRINIKLNPAELGAIEINLTVKEKTIKASVVAQSQITHGILERNLDRIRSILEKQGFTINEINIMTSNHASAEFDFFEREFTRQQQQTLPGNQPGKLSTPKDNREQDQQREESGVNLTV